jgi:hypothetical protein
VKWDTLDYASIYINSWVQVNEHNSPDFLLVWVLSTQTIIFMHFFSFLHPLLLTEFHLFLTLTITHKDIVHLGIRLHKNIRNKVVHMFSKISISKFYEIQLCLSTCMLN